MSSLLLFLAAASLAPTSEADGARGQGKAVAGSRGSASIRIVRPFRLTPAVLSKDVPGAQVVRRVIAARDGQRRPADLVEFE